MIASKKASAFAAALPAIYLITGIILDAIFFSKSTEVVSTLDILLMQHYGYIMVFEVIVLAISLILTYFVVELSNICTYQNVLRCSPFINIGIGLFLFVNFWFIGIAVAFISALTGAVMLYMQSKK